MATAAAYFNPTRKRLIGTEDLKDRLMDHVRTLVQESFERSFRTGVVYDTALGLASGGTDRVSVTGTSIATDGQGHLLDIDANGYNTGLYFQNALGVVYEVGLKYADIPDGLQINPRTGLPEFIAFKEAVGVEAEPDLVTDNGSTITFRVNSSTEAGVSNAGRQVLVYKKEPGKNAITEGQAVEIRTVVWSGGHNIVTTSGLLGQDAGSVSTTASDYVCVLMGPHITRNTVIYGTDGYCFLGEVTGVGAGGSPAAFVTTNQDVLDASLSDLQDITSRNASTDRLKVDVKSYAGDVSDPQIAVRDPGGSIVFEVDGNGNVVIQGTTTQQDVVQVNSSETITDNLTAGDATGDSHLIKGTWRHTDPGASANYFRVDGATGRIGINQVPEVSASESVLAQLAITGDVRLLGDLRVQGTIPVVHFRDTNGGVNTGGLWRAGSNANDFSIHENTAAAGDFSTFRDWMRINNAGDRFEMDANVAPNTNNTRDLGISGLEWRDLYVNRTGYIDELVLENAAGAGVGSDMVPDGTNTRDLGSLSRRFAETHTRDLYLGTTAGEGVGSNVMPQADNTYSLGSSTRRWASIWTQNLNFAGDFLPQVDGTQDIGSTTFRWAEGHYSGSIQIGDAHAHDPERALNIQRTLTTTTTPESFVRSNVTWSAANVSANRYGFDIGATVGANTSRLEGLQLSASATSGVSIGYWLLGANISAGMSGGGNSAARLGGARISYGSGGGTVTDLYGLWLDGDNWTNVTDHYGIRVDAGAGTPSGDHYSFYSEVGAGDVQISDRLQVGPLAYASNIAHVMMRNPGDTTNPVGGVMAAIDYEVNNASFASSMTGLQVFPKFKGGAGGGNFAMTGASIATQVDSGVTLTNSHQVLSLSLTNNSAGAAVPSSYMLRVYSPSGSASPTNHYGIYIDNQAHGATNYALYTNTGIVRLGGYLNAVGRSLDFHPFADDSYDLGSTTYQWRNLYIDGTANIDTLSLSTTAGEGVGTSMVPTTDNSYDLGASGYEWRDLYVDGTAYLDTISGVGTITATTFSGTYLSLASGAGQGVQSHLVPFTDGTYTLGNASYRWSTVYTRSILVDDTAGWGVSSHLVPASDDTYDLGNATYQWRNGYFDGTLTTDLLSVSNTAGEGVSNHFNPSADDSYDLGSSTYQWRNLYIDGTVTADLISLSTTAGEGFSTNLLPSATNRDLGSSSYRWDLYSGFISSNSYISGVTYFSHSSYINGTTWHGFTASTGSGATGRVYANSSDYSSLYEYHSLKGSTAGYRNVGELQYIATRLTGAQMTDGASDIIVPAQGANTLICPVMIMVHRRWVSVLANFSAVPPINLGGFGWSNRSSTVTGWNNGNYDEWYNYSPSNSGSVDGASGSSNSFNNSLYINGSGGTAGNCIFYVHVWYTIMRVRTD